MGSFPTSGQVDWVSLMKVPFQVPIGILSRISAAQVQPYTIVVAENLGHLFHLTAEGRQRIRDAISKLKSFQTLCRALYIGIGIEHVIHILARTEEGAMCIALCGSLSEFYAKSTASEILIEMVKTKRAPEELRPSISEWSALLDACGGTFAASPLSTLAEKYMQLHPDHRMLGYNVENLAASKVRGCSSAESLATALIALAEVTRGDLASLTIIGGADAGWLAAFAEWFFELSIRIILGSTGEVLYPGQGSEHNVQVLIVYNSVGTVAQNMLVTTDRTHRLSDATSLIRQESDTNYSEACVAGRVEWDKILALVFGPEFKKMRGNSHAVGVALGSLARILQGVASAEDGIRPLFRQEYGHYNDSSYGKGLVLAILHRFPELGSFRDPMERAVRQDLSNAFMSYESSMSALQIACNCRRCQEGLGIQDDYCCVMIVEVIVVLAQTMSIATLPIEISPSRLGIETIYAKQVEIFYRMENQAYSDDTLKEFGPAIRAVKAYRQPLFDTIKIFCGRLPADLANRDNESAFSANGICVYYGALSQLCDNNESVDRVVVVPGRIELHQKVYYRITDLTIPFVQHTTGWPNCLSFDELSVVVKEKHDGLQLAFEVYQSGLGSGQKVLMLPATTVRLLWKRRGLIPCMGTACGTITKDAKIKEESPGYKLCELAGVQIEVFEVNLLQRWMLMNTKKAATGLVFWAGKECIDCCLRAAVESVQGKGSVGERATVIRSEEGTGSWETPKTKKILGKFGRRDKVSHGKG